MASAHHGPPGAPKQKDVCDIDIHEESNFSKVVHEIRFWPKADNLTTIFSPRASQPAYPRLILLFRRPEMPNGLQSPGQRAISKRCGRLRNAEARISLFTPSEPFDGKLVEP